MDRYLLDTNVLSEVTKLRPHSGAVAWLRAAGDCYLSVLSIGELQRGVWQLRSRDPLCADSLDAWLEELKAAYSDRILPVDDVVANAWARRPATRTVPVVDALLAATAQVHGLAIATRNTADFADLDVHVINPFA